MTSGVDESSTLSVLSNNTDVYRLASSKRRHIHPDTGEFLPTAYLLRPNETGLSVFIAALSPLPYLIDSVLDPCHGIDELRVGNVRGIWYKDYNLDIVPKRDPKHGDKHAEITGLPRLDESEEDANRLADLLAQQSVRKWRRGEPVS